MNRRLWVLMMFLSTVAANMKGETNQPAVTNAPSATNGPTFQVRGYLVVGNSVLPPDKFGVLSNYTGEVSLARVRQGLGELQLLYHDLGFPTVAVSLPQQKLTNGLVRVQIVQGKLSDIVIVGNRFFSSNNIRRALPSLETNVLINTKWFQPELDRANANADRQIYPVLGPGPDPGSSAVTLKVKDRLPLHGHVEIDNKATPETPALRIDTALQYNNLWQLEHQIGAEYNFSPQETKPDDASRPFYDQPAVVSYSAFYRIPLSLGRNLRENYADQPVDFGYDQVTHRFNLPPLTGGPEFIAFASRSTSDTGAHAGPVIPITETATLNVFNQTLERNPTTTGDVGTRFIVPLPQVKTVQSSLSFGWDYKAYQTGSLVTNLTTVEQFTTNPPTLINSAIVTNATLSDTSLHYLPLSWGWSGSRSDKWGSTSLNFNQNLFLSGLSWSREEFQRLAASRSAGGNYTTLLLGLVREQRLFGEWSSLLRANGQWSSAPLINNEQFALGGTGGVRGYQEGEVYGDTGWRLQFDLRAPPVNVGYFPDPAGDIPATLRCSWFMDYGQTYLIDRPAIANDMVQQWGTGLGFFLTVGQHIDARLTLGWALQDTPLTRAGTCRAYFSVGVQF